MINPQLIFIIHILSLMYLPSYKAELCKDDGVEFEIEYVLEDQPVFVTCPLQYLLNEDNFNVTWLRNGSQSEITSDIQMRLHQDQSYLKFIPAMLNDTGYYSCVLRNSTYCIQRLKKIEVFKNDEGLCYNHTIMFRYIPIMQSILTIECPDMMKYIDKRSTPMKWFKECQPLNLDNDKYKVTGNLLNIKNATLQDKGNYTCESTNIFNGRDYKISRTIDYFIAVQPLQSAPVMINPKNDFLQVELGAAITLTCEALFNGMIDLYWTFNDSFMDEYSDDDRVVMGDMYRRVSPDGNRVNSISLNFTTVKEEDYGREFYCHLSTAFHRKAFVVLKHPEPNLQGFLIAFFVAMVSVIVISVIAIRVFKVEIVLWYRSSCFAHTDHKDGKIYDAYIMYPKNFMGSSYEMDIFVLKVLPEVLEKQCDYRLFIIGRDDLPGQAIADLVDETISQSRRLIIILGDISSENSLDDDFEQKIAMYDALIRNKIKVILIELGKITDYTYIPESIKYIKQKQGVVRWKGEFTEKSLHPNTRFWKNIRYRMPSAQHSSDRELYYIGSED